MKAKLAFGIPIFLGLVTALIIGFKTSWATNLWGLALFLGIITGSVIFAVLKRAKQKELEFLSKKKSVVETFSRTDLIIEIIFLFSAMICIRLPISTKRGIFIGDHIITARSILIAGMVLIGIRLLIRLLQYVRK